MDHSTARARPFGMKPISFITSGVAAGFVIGAGLMFWFTYDPVTSYKIGSEKFGYLEKSVSQNSPIARCKQRLSTLEAIIADKTGDLSRVSGEIFQLKTKAGDTAMQFTKDGIVRVPYAQNVQRCEAGHAGSSVYSVYPVYPKDNSPPTRCSSLLDEQIRDVQEKEREYSELQKAKAQKSDEFDQLQQECFGFKK
jgi:hypothetical protein